MVSRTVDRVVAARAFQLHETPPKKLVGNGFTQENFGLFSRVIALVALIFAPFNTKEWGVRQRSILMKGSVLQLTIPSVSREYTQIMGNVYENGRVTLRMKAAVGDVLYSPPSEECPKGKLYIINRQYEHLNQVGLEALDIQQLRGLYKTSPPDELEHLIANWDQGSAHVSRVELERQLKVLKQLY